MTDTGTDTSSDTHPITTLHNSSQTLREQTQFAHRQAATGAANARRAIEELAALDMEKAFRQLHQMVELLGGKSTRTTARAEAKVVAFPDRKPFAEAAE